MMATTTIFEQAIEKHVDALKTLKGPVYDVEGKNHYEAIVKHVESLKSLQVWSLTQLFSVSF